MRICATSYYFSAALRDSIPSWAIGAQLRVNGKPTAQKPKPGTYAHVEQEWSSGDVGSLTLPMLPRLMEAHPSIEADQDRVAVMRGHLLYCLESVDLLDGVRLSQVRIPRDIQLMPRYDPHLLGGVTILEGDAQ